MKIISLMHENMNLSMEIDEYLERTSKGSLEQTWTDKFIEKLQFYKSLHSTKMLKEIKTLCLNQKALQLSIKDFYNNFPELEKRYNYLDYKNLLEDGYIYSQLSFNLFEKEYLFKYKISDKFDFLETTNSKDSLNEKNLLLENKEFNYSLDVYTVREKVLHLNEKSLKQSKFDSFLENIEYILELDNLSLSNFLENNASLKNYMHSREIIPQILTRCNDDSLLAPVTSESLKVYETLFTQKNIYNIKPDIKMNKLR